MSINGIHVKKFMRAESDTIVQQNMYIADPVQQSKISYKVFTLEHSCLEQDTAKRGTIEQVTITMLFIKLHSILTIIWIKHEPKHWKGGTASQRLRSCKFSYNQDSAHHRMQSCDNRKDTIEIRSCKVCMMNLSYLAPLCR